MIGIACTSQSMCGHGLRLSILHPSNQTSLTSTRFYKNAEALLTFSFFFIVQVGERIFPSNACTWFTAGNCNRQEGRNRVPFIANRWTCKLITHGDDQNKLLRSQVFVDELSAGGLSLAKTQFLPRVWAGQRVELGAGKRAVGNSVSLVAHLLRLWASCTPVLWVVSHSHTRPAIRHSPPLLWSLPEHILGTLPLGRLNS